MNIFKSIAKKVKELGTKELTTKESMTMMKNLIKNDKVPIQKHLKTGNLVTFVYDAKNKEDKYDRTPFVMVLSRTSKYMLGINFHWMPVNRRMMLVEYLLKTQSKQIRNKTPFNVSYRKLKAFVKGLGAYPVIRLYIRGRISAKGVKVPNELLMQASKMKTETFTKGKTNSTTLWTRAKQKALSVKRKLT